MPNDTKKWVRQFLFGTGLPALLGLGMMTVEIDMVEPLHKPKL